MGRAVERQKHFIELSVVPLRVEDETEETREVVLPVAKALGLVDVIADPVDGARERASVHKDLAPLVLDDLTQIPYERGQPAVPGRGDAWNRERPAVAVSHADVVGLHARERMHERDRARGVALQRGRLGRLGVDEAAGQAERRQ